MKRFAKVSLIISIIGMIAIIAFSVTSSILYYVFVGTPGPHRKELTITVWTIALVILSIITVIEFAANFFNKTATWNTFLLAFFILLYLLTSPEGKYYFSTITDIPSGLTLIRALNNLFFGLSIVFYTRFALHDYLKELRKTSIAIIAFILLTVLSIGGSILAIWRLDYFVIWVMVGAAIIAIVLLLMFAVRRGTADLTFFLAMLIPTLLIASEIAVALGVMTGISTYSYGLVSFNGIICGVLFVAIYIVFTIRLIGSADSGERYKQELEILQTKILREQINPHFFFNLLNHIKVIYRKSPEEGDHAIDLLSKHLRANVMAGDIYLVPFSTELENISYYVELANLGYTEKFNIIYNVDCYDFEVPILSLQPFVENAIRYSQVITKKGGFIEIGSEETDHDYIVKIIDNGIGFDPASVEGKSQGIKNASNRFKLLLGADVAVESESGKGTRIIIKIPKKNQKGVANENHSG